MTTPNRARQKRKLLKTIQEANQPISMSHLVHPVLGEYLNPGRKYDQSRPIRHMIAELQEEGYPICHKSGKYGGYYLANSDEDIETEAQWHERRALSHLRRASWLKKLSIKEVAEQLDLQVTP